MKPIGIHKSYEIARERYAEFGIETENVLAQMGDFHLSFNSWHVDKQSPKTSHARRIEQLRQDFKNAMRLVPGEHRLTLQTSFAEKDGKCVDAEAMDATNFEGWMQWSRDTHTPLDLHVTTQNPNDRLTLSSSDPMVRLRWWEYISRCRKIANTLGENQKAICLMNLQVNDALEEPSLNRILHRQVVEESLEKVLSSKMTWIRDSISSCRNDCNAVPVLSYNELISYAIKHQRIISISTDQESISPDSIVDNISSLMLSLPGLVFHLCRPVVWFNRQLEFMDSARKSLFLEIVNSGIQHRVHYLLDYRNPSICRSSAYVIGARATQRCMMCALLEPVQMIHFYELNGNHVEKTILLEEVKSMPWGAVYDEFCVRNNVPVGTEIFEELK